MAKICELFVECPYLADTGEVCNDVGRGCKRDVDFKAVEQQLAAVRTLLADCSQLLRLHGSQGDLQTIADIEKWMKDGTYWGWESLLKCLERYKAENTKMIDQLKVESAEVKRLNAELARYSKIIDVKEEWALSLDKRLREAEDKLRHQPSSQVSKEEGN